MNRLNTLQSPSNEVDYATFDTGASRPETINVGSSERAASLLGGGALVAVGLFRGRLSGLALAAVGALIARRGLRGHCDVYDALGINTAEQQRAADPHQLYEHGVKLEDAIIVNKPASQLYDYWRDLTNLSRFMTNVQRVEIRDSGHSHWTVRAPGGTTIEYDAEVINDEPGRLLAWRSTGGADIEHAGSVRFLEQSPGATTVKLNIEYIPPVGVLGEWGEKLLRVVGQSPQNDIGQSLRNFKQLMEAGTAVDAGSMNNA